MSQNILRQATRLTRPDSHIDAGGPVADDRPAVPGKHVHPDPTLVSSLRHFLLGNYVNVLLVFIPLGFVAHYVGWAGVLIFVFNFLAIIPLASLLGYATEEIALRFGETIGGLLNATFGNAVELIIAIVAVKDGMIRVVQASLLGSILSNLLLVLGLCFLLGGFRYSEQSFNLTAAQNYASLLALSCLSLLIPAAFWLTLTNHEKADQAVLRLSHIAAIFMLLVYVFYLYFQLRTHAHLYEAGNEEKAPAAAAAAADDDDDDTEYATLTLPFAAVALVLVTVLVAFHAEMLVSSIEAITKGGSLSDTFVGLILLPIVGNAAEHMTAVTTAMKNKMDLAIGVALGSSMQIALLVTPLLVIIGWAIGQPMTLFFHGFETVVLFVSVLITNYLIMDGKSNWLEGMMLLSTYAIVAVAFFYYPDEDKPSSTGH
ncbi:Sodium/calcium exchanger protein-domain-containing protein [Syncephalis pseudoplumigaleata]|uniref:Vacuolar calcium ion transporter n=1 Tax=Syncephalis pseudoplumigaleata TaxID=1712513 RepID=A0A4P9Z0P7_9FUNG|nr:Sodium/calcium exchanger protein-domain-containing protein [Syncephalis pseudoplumigaleata]|eukprot:RKP25271.1 Sodium/calcium exchanger protein-domain-containing protein [Syncephalis pseudoplumigaleata]